MSAKETKNLAASVLERLRNKSKSSGAPFQQVLQQYAIERFLYRISKSKHAKSVILKGALLLKTIGIPSARPTMDIDMLRQGKADQATLVALVKDCATLEVDPDGLEFLADSVVPEDIAKDSDTRERGSSWTRAWATCVSECTRVLILVPENRIQMTDSHRLPGRIVALPMYLMLALTREGCCP
jgi:hypothetical protein